MLIAALKRFCTSSILRVLVLGGLSICLAAQTQGPPGSTAPPLVKFDIIVTDGAGYAVPNLRKEDVQLSDDGYVETIELFAKAERPLTYGLVIDGSNSLNTQFEDVLNAAKQIIAANNDQEETFIIKFVTSDNIRTIQELTSDKSALTNSLNRLKLEMGQTALIDGVYLATEHALKVSKDGQSVRLIVISDGEDRASYYTESALFALLAKSNVQVFPVGIIGHLDDDGGMIRLSVRARATALLEKLARETGGRAFILESKKDLPAATEQLINNLHLRYAIGYRPTKNPDKASRKIKVKLVTTPDNKKWTVISPRVVGTRK